MLPCQGATATVLPSGLMATNGGQNRGAAMGAGRDDGSRSWPEGGAYGQPQRSVAIGFIEMVEVPEVD